MVYSSGKWNEPSCYPGILAIIEDQDGTIINYEYHWRHPGNDHDIEESRPAICPQTSTAWAVSRALLSSDEAVSQLRNGAGPVGPRRLLSAIGPH